MKTLRRVPIALSLSILGLCSSIQWLPADTVVVFNSFGPGNTFDTLSGWGVTGSSTAGGYRGQAQPFVPTASGALAAIELAMGRSGGSGRCNYAIALDVGGIPGTILESFPNVASPGTFGSAYPPLLLKSTALPDLQAGTRYWVCAEPADSTTSSAWNYNTQGSSGLFAFERAPWSWDAVNAPLRDGVLRVTLTPIPEPSTVALGLLAGLLVFCRWRGAS